jgi:nicotinamidase-related amidase
MMTTPSFYAADKVGMMYTPDIGAALQAGRIADVLSSVEDTQRRLLLLVDPQVDFIHIDGALSVPGAVVDTRRTIEWLFANLESVTDIAVSLDSHIPLMIFFPTWWADNKGRHPEPFTPISAQQVRSGEWVPQYEQEWSRKYVDALEIESKKQLMIWPYHTMIGTPGHTVTPALAEAIAFHAAARNAQPEYLIKGTIARTEYYSLLEPEVKDEDDPRGDLNQDFLNRLMGYDAVYVAGQAKSHCVLESIGSIVARYGDQAESMSKIHLLEDCTSSVQHPEIDFEAMALETYAQWETLGLQRVGSSQPIKP